MTYLTIGLLLSVSQTTTGDTTGADSNARVRELDALLSSASASVRIRYDPATWTDDDFDRVADDLDRIAPCLEKLCQVLDASRDQEDQHDVNALGRGIGESLRKMGFCVRALCAKSIVEWRQGRHDEAYEYLRRAIDAVAMGSGSSPLAAVVGMNLTRNLFDNVAVLTGGGILAGDNATLSLVDSISRLDRQLAELSLQLFPDKNWASTLSDDSFLAWARNCAWATVRLRVMRASVEGHRRHNAEGGWPTMGDLSCRGGEMFDHYHFSLECTSTRAGCFSLRVVEDPRVQVTIDLSRVRRGA